MSERKGNDRFLSWMFQVLNFVTHVGLLSPWSKIVPVAVQSYLPMHLSAHNVDIIMDNVCAHTLNR